MLFPIDGWLEDSWYAPSSDKTDGKPKPFKQPSLLEINPSYGILSSTPENTKETGAETTKAVVYVNDPKHEAAIDEEYELINVSPKEPQTSKKQLTRTVSNDDEVHYI